LAGWHPPSLPTAPAKGIWTTKLSYPQPEKGEQVSRTRSRAAIAGVKKLPPRGSSQASSIL